MSRYPKVPPIATALDHTYRCRICGYPENLGYFNENCEFLPVMREQKICYSCAFWKKEIEERPSDREVIGDSLYVIHPYPEDVDAYESGTVQGASCYVYKPDRSFYRSYQMAKLGVIPERFKEHFPETAKFITGMGFYRLIKNNFICRAKGCWDRYHCLRYDMECEKDGPFNEIPKNYKIGDEECSSFINKNNLFV